MLFYDYKKEFGHLLADGWEDSTYGNDVCPSFVQSFKTSEGIDYTLRLWLDFPKYEDRESSECTRFGLTLVSDEDYEFISDIKYSDSISVILYITKDIAEIEAKLFEWVAKGGLEIPQPCDDNKVTELGELL